MKLKIIAVVVLLLILIGCTLETEVLYIDRNHTEIRIINNSVPCTPCICDPCKTPELKCDNSPYQKCQLEKGRLIYEVSYYKNLSVSLINDTSDILKSNLTLCLEEKKLLKDKLELINKSLK